MHTTFGLHSHNTVHNILQMQKLPLHLSVMIQYDKYHNLILRLTIKLTIECLCVCSAVHRLNGQNFTHEELCQYRRIIFCVTT